VVVAVRGDAAEVSGDSAWVDTAWVDTAFGGGAQLSRRELGVIVKGMPTKRLREYHDDADLAAVLRRMSTPAITRSKKSIPSGPQPYGAIIPHIDGVKAAKLLCAEGLL
jgi:hypothetical protein